MPFGKTNTNAMKIAPIATAHADGGNDDPAEPVVPTRPVGEMKSDEVEQLREREREHCEVNAAAAQAEEADDGAADQGGGDADAERQPERRELELGEGDAGA